MNGAHDSIKAYMAAVKKIPQLTPERESELGNIIATSNDKHEVEEARKVFANHYPMLVVKVANGFWKGINQRNHHATKLDLIADGNVGLIRASLQFDPSRGPFAKYAARAIFREIHRSFYEQYQAAIFPPRYYKLLVQMREVERKMIEDGEEITDDAVRDRMGLAPYTFAQLKEAKNFSTISLDEPVAGFSEDYEELTLMDIIASEEPTPLECVASADMMAFLENKISDFTELEKEALGCKVFGKNESTLTAIAQKYGFSLQYIADFVCPKALKKLKQRLLVDPVKDGLLEEWQLEEIREQMKNG